MIKYKHIIKEWGRGWVNNNTKRNLVEILTDALYITVIMTILIMFIEVIAFVLGTRISLVREFYSDIESSITNLQIVSSISSIMIYIIRKQIGQEEPEYRKYLLTKLESEPYAFKRNGLEERKAEKEKKVDTIMPDKKDIFALMLKNNDEITEYFKISKG